MNRIAMILLLLVAPILSAAADEKKSVYTDLKLDGCKEEPPQPDMPIDGGVGWCEGYQGMPVRVAEGDLRFLVSYGETAADEIAASQTLAAFNTIGEKLEWRLELGSDDGLWHAFATILRFHTESGDGQKGQYLVITKLGGPGQICHVGYVDARLNPDPNTLARQVADESAAAFTCGTDEPGRFGLVRDEDR